jgi:hypothetical protein
MNKHELLEKLIPYYESVIELVKDETDLDYVKATLDAKHVDAGICSTARLVFDENIYLEEWVNRNKTGFFSWECPPAFAHSVSDAISLLQVRVDIMKKELLIN